MNSLKYLFKLINNLYYIKKFYNAVITETNANKYVYSMDQSFGGLEFCTDKNSACPKIQSGLISYIISCVSKASMEMHSEEVEKLKFILCCYIDETMYSIIGESEWSSMLLEEYFFSTRIGGEKIITNIVDMLAKKTSNLNSLFVYYFMISSGFKGVYKNEPRRLESLKHYILLSIEKIYTAGQSANINPEINRFIISNTKKNVVVDYNVTYGNISILICFIFILFVSFVIYFSNSYSYMIYSV